MPHIRVEFDTTPEKANTFHKRVIAGRAFPDEKQRAINRAWEAGRTPTGEVHYRGIGNGKPPTLKFDVEINLDTETP